MNDMPASPRATPASFRVNQLHVEPSTGLITGSKGKLRLEPRVMAVLQALASRPGELVTRTELLSEIWPGGNTYDEALTQCVYQLRQLMITAGGDECRNLITTVPKRGYLLKAEVQPVAPEVADDAPASQAPGKEQKILVGMLAAALVLAGIWAVFAWRSGADADPAMPHADTVAVLPFLPLVEESRDPVLELGMADTLIARLSGIRQIVVRPISSVRQYADLDRDALRAGRDLGADAVVEGSIQRSGQDLRVTVRLLRVGDGTALWADSFHESSTSMFAVQDAIAERIAAALAQEFGQQVQPKPARLGTSDDEAYEYYLKGRYDLARLTPRDMRASVEHFRRAVARDPNYAQAWLGLAGVQIRIPIAGEGLPNDYYPEAKAAALRALEIDPNLAEGHALLGMIAQWYEWDWAASEAHFKRAIELDPNDSEGHLGYAHLLSVTGRHQQALAEVRRARELSPFYLMPASLEGFFLTRAQRPEEAIQRLGDARLQNEDFWLIRLHLTEAYIAAGQNENAAREAEVARQLSGGNTLTTAHVIAGLGRLDRSAEAEALLEELLQRSVKNYVPPFDLALAYEGVGDPIAAMAWLERAFEVRDPKLVLLGVGGWESVRDRPEFLDLIERIGLPESAQ